MARTEPSGLRIKISLSECFPAPQVFPERPSGLLKGLCGLGFVTVESWWTASVVSAGFLGVRL